MHLQFPSGQLARLRDRTRLLAECAADHQARIEALVASTQRDLRQAEAAIAAVAGGSDDRPLPLLVDALRRSAAATGQLGVSAGAQHSEAVRLLTYLGGNRHGFEHPPSAVLVADDSGPVRDAVARLLRHAGFVVSTAANGLEALLAAHATRPGVIVMDVTMPILDGIAATRLIQATEVTRHTRVIAHTDSVEVHEGPARALFAAVLRKPAPPETLIAAVQQWTSPIDTMPREATSV